MGQQLEPVEPEVPRSSDPLPVDALDAIVRRERVWQVSQQLSYVATAGWLGFALLHLAAGRHAIAAVHVGAAVFAATGAAFARGRRGRAEMPMFFTAGGTLAGLGAVAVMTGGAFAPALTFMGLVPLVAGLVDSPWERRLWLVVSLSSVGAVSVIALWVPPAWVVEAGAIERFGAPIGVGVVLFGFGSLWRRSTDRHIALLLQQKRTIEDQRNNLAAAGVELERARDAAVAASDAKSRFVSVTSHELRGPLNGIVGMSHALRDTQLSAGQSELVDALLMSASSLGELLHDLLDLGKIEAGRLDVVRRPFDPRELLADVADQFAHVASEKGIEIAACSDLDVPASFDGDAGRLRQTLANLVGNAVKFSDTGSVILRLRRTDGALLFEVIDTGRGMSEADKARIFAPFEQASAELADRRAGTGLGLWIARAITDAMGGTLSVETKQGHGSTFSLRLPVEPPDADIGAATRALRPTLLVLTRSDVAGQGFRSVAAHVGVGVIVARDPDAVGAASDSVDLVIVDIDASADEALVATARARFPRARLVLAASGPRLARTEALAGPAGGGIMLKPARARRLAAVLSDGKGAPSGARGSGDAAKLLSGTLLVVDDGAINRKVARFAAEQMGLLVQEAPSGEAALSLMEAGRPDVLLLDLHLGGIDGVATAREVLQRWPDDAPAIVGYTAAVDEADRRRCLESGMDDVVSKPLDRALFVATIARAAARRRRTG